MLTAIKNKLLRKNNKHNKTVDAEKAEKERIRLEEAVDTAVAEMQWTSEQALEDIARAKKLYKISARDYNLYEFFRIPEEDRAVVSERIRQEKARNKANKEKSSDDESHDNTALYIETIKKNTGWSDEEVQEKLADARKRTGANLGNYVILRFWELTDEEQETYPTRGFSKKVSAKYSQEFSSTRRMFFCKDMFMEKAGPYLGRKWISTINMKWPEFRELFIDENRVIYKPRADKGGAGIEVFKFNSEEELKEVFDKLWNMPLGVVESFIIQHPEMKKFSSNSVNTLRFVTIRTNNPAKGIETGVTHFVYGGMRMGAGKSFVDNLHGGGMITSFDIDTGVIVTNAVDYEGNVYEKHPDTGAVIKGFKIPFFNEAKKIIDDISQELDIEGYYGWDIAITENGPVIVEGNNMPGVGMLQLPYVPEKKGMKHVFDKFIQPEAMTIENNRWLEDYEIKHPDLEYRKRAHVGMSDASYQPLRYEKKDDCWNKINQSRGRFGKSEAKLLFTGDITCFDKQFEEAQSGDDYDFDFEFKEVAPVFKAADLVVGNLETAIVPDAPYRSEKVVIEENFYCNAPLEFLAAIRNAGVDVVTNANNHDIDAGAVGLGETIDNIEKFGFIHTGTFKAEDKRYELFNVNCINVAIVAFATDHNALSCNLKKEGVDFLLNDYSPERAETVISSARAAGADVVIACMHWGKENKNEVHKDQYKIANTMAQLGYDCIVGSHPHVLQKFDVVKVGDKEMPVFYSLGNFVSQNFNNKKARSIIACIDLVKKGSSVSLKCSYIPVYTSEQYKGRKLVVLPLNNKTNDKKQKNVLRKISKEVEDRVNISTAYDIVIKLEDKVECKMISNVEQPDLCNDRKFKIIYNDGWFIFELQKDKATLLGIDKDYITVSCTVPEEVCGIPVTDMKVGAFENNSYLRKVKAVSFPYVGEKMFKGCHLMEGYRMGLHTTEIRTSAFEDCVNLQSAIMKRGIKRVESRAFAGCVNLLSVKLPGNVEYIADDAFEGCGKMTIYCPRGSYAEKYAKEHGIPAIYMEFE